MEVKKDISQVEFFMPDGSIRKYVVGEEIDEKKITEIRMNSDFITVTFFEIIETYFSCRESVTFLTMPTSIPYSIGYEYEKPWYAKAPESRKFGDC